MLGRHPPIRLHPDMAPILLVVVDTEEEFDWTRGHDPMATSVGAMARIDRVQRIFDLYGITPTYVVDHPVALQPDGYLPLKEIQDSGRALIGAHLHPWVNPPHLEAYGAASSYPGNLPRELEAAKLRILTERIHETFGRRPRVYKAGRYGVGKNTATTLETLGYDVDVSVCPPFDYREDGGPDFSSAHAEPYWFGHARRLLELPLTGAYVGVAGAASHALYGFATGRLGLGLRAPGVLSRLGIVDRLCLSPEGYSPREHVKLTRWLLDRGARVFSWTFHSPSVEPGHTPYVRSRAELDRFLDSFRRYFDHFFGDLGGTTLGPLELLRHLESTS